jgi:hypothetical protein
MRDAELERERKILNEAFRAGWQAALAVKITHPGVLAVVESCFEQWLREEVDERGVLGLPFRRRHDLPSPDHRPAAHRRVPGPPPAHRA